MDPAGCCPWQSGRDRCSGKGLFEVASVRLGRAQQHRHAVERDAVSAVSRMPRAISAHSRPSPGAEKIATSSSGVIAGAADLQRRAGAAASQASLSSCPRRSPPIWRTVQIDDIELQGSRKRSRRFVRCRRRSNHAPRTRAHRGNQFRLGLICDPNVEEKSGQPQHLVESCRAARLPSRRLGRLASRQIRRPQGALGIVREWPQARGKPSGSSLARTRQHGVLSERRLRLWRSLGRAQSQRIALAHSLTKGRGQRE